LIAHRLKREQKIIAAFSGRNPATIDDLVPVAYADTSPKLHAVARRSLHAHLIKLERDGQVRQVGEHWTLRTDATTWQRISFAQAENLLVGSADFYGLCAGFWSEQPCNFEFPESSPDSKPSRVELRKVRSTSRHLGWPCACRSRKICAQRSAETCKPRHDIPQIVVVCNEICADRDGYQSWLSRFG
jgi:hypothetical protein